MNNPIDKMEADETRRLVFLAIEDERTVSKMYSDFLDEMGYDLVVAESGVAAEEIVNNGHYDVVILDLKLPDVHGSELLKKIKEKIKDVPVIIVTANPTLESAVEAVRAGIVYDYIIKPFGMDNFRLVIQRAAEKVLLMYENQRLSRKLDIVNLALKERVEELEGFAGKAVEYEDTIRNMKENLTQLEDTLTAIKKGKK